MSNEKSMRKAHVQDALFGALSALQREDWVEMMARIDEAKIIGHQVRKDHDGD